VTAQKRAESRWFGKTLSFEEMASLPLKERREELRRKVEEVERAALASPKPRASVLAKVARLKARLGDASRTKKP
jgi:chorismate mutase